MEICNTSSATEGTDVDAACWDELLGMGKKIFGVATDDGHSMSDHCKGWVMVNSENKIDSILDALERGDFYSSTGPEIYDFYIGDDNRAHIKCEGVQKIYFISDCHPNQYAKAEDDTLTEASADMNYCGGYKYIRAAIYKKDGSRAWTNPIWIEE